MKLPFKRKNNSQENLQTLQAEFNQVLYELGDLNYRKHMVAQELTKINSEINSRIQKMDDMGVKAAVLREAAQKEVLAKAKEGANKLKVEDNVKAVD